MFVIHWGQNKDGSPFFESNLTINDLAESPVDPTDNRVCKYPSMDNAMTHLELVTDFPDAANVIPLETATEIFSTYLLNQLR